MNYIPDLIFFSKGFTHSHKQYMPYNKYGPKHTRLGSRINDKDSTVVAGIFSPFATSHICHWHKKMRHRILRYRCKHLHCINLCHRYLYTGRHYSKPSSRHWVHRNIQL